MEDQSLNLPRSRRSLGRDLRILRSISEALNSAADVQQALARTLALVADLLGLRTGWIWLLDPDTRHFYSAAAQNLPPYLQEPVRMQNKSCSCIDSFCNGSLTPSNIRLIGCSRLYAAVATNEQEATGGLWWHASIPLHFQGKPLGIMNVTGPSWRELTSEELRLLSTIAYQVGIAVERARLAEESTRLARAEERARLAREIHDTLAQGLTAIALQIEGAIDHVHTNPKLACERLQRALTTTRDNLEEARRSVLDLRAAPLAGKPLAEALRSLGRALAAEHGIRVELKVHASVTTLPIRVEAELYRIAQEALANVQRHAHATLVTIALHRKAETLRMVIHNDGPGFDVRTVRENCHGLVGMRERAKLLGGKLRLESRPERGTTVVVNVPIPVDPAES